MSLSNERLSSLRKLLKQNDIDAYIIPHADPNLGEYISDHWRIVEWLTGFTGSAATLMITDSFAGLWTDSRYFIQAENQLLDSGFILMKPELPDKKDFIEWMAINTDPGSIIAMDGRIFSIGRMKRLEKILKPKKILFNFKSDLISELWTDRPTMPVLIAFEHPVLYCGKARETKIAEVRTEMKRLNIDYHLLTSSDDIMWLLNIRGGDIKYSPLLTSFAVIDEKQILLFTDESKIPFRLAMEFDKLGIVILPYEEIEGILSTLRKSATILITPSTTSASLFFSLPARMKIIEDISIPTRLKAIKNRTEIENIGRVMVKDGIALTKFFYWFEQNLGSSSLTEISLVEKLSSFRSEQENYMGPSFCTIAAFNEHGALPHYSSTPESDSVIGKKGILLLDSGGQYLDGTTDITRTIAIGRPTELQKKDFTLVLKGTINLALAKFPEGTRGSQLDILARKALWENGLNYGHGTGHGVGFFLNVHEGPQSISHGNGAEARTIIEPGMLISDEPAIYRAGEYGIRIENLILCYEDEETEFGKFLRFETVSLCYIEKSLINISLLDQREIDWLNSYHTEVYEKLSPSLSEAEKVWLKGKTAQI